jgi:hypothetical protein
MSQIGRFVELKRACVCIKAFIEFISLDGTSAEVITMKNRTKLEQDELNLEEVRGQSYDNVATMAGVLSRA